ncbi:MAG: ATPase, partial [Oscillospiraceae bacterium]|nr:ATPase [Oscillospiraceae bacterium]
MNFDNSFLGIEFGSTRIKAVVIDRELNVLAQGSHTWENRLVDGIWSYSADDITGGLQACYRSLKDDIKGKYGTVPTSFTGMGISAMMHGYMAFDKDDELLVPFRTWRNTITERAAAELTAALGFNIPQRWTAAHLYQAVLDHEPHIGDISKVSTLAGYIQYRLTGEYAVGVGEGSGIFPTDGIGYHKGYADIMNKMLSSCGFDRSVLDLFPVIRPMGYTVPLTEAGARLIDPDGDLTAGVPVCPPEGDAQTGMVATNSVRRRTGNISAGTSIFSMLVLDKPMKELHEEIDIVATPSGDPVAMVHCNNCCSELDQWVRAAYDVARMSGADVTMSDMYRMLYKNAMTSSADGISSYNFLSGEPVLGVVNGKPVTVRTPGTDLSVGGFIRSQIYSAFAAIRYGSDILKNEGITADSYTVHGGMFKVEDTTQQILSDALDTPTSVMETAGEGGAWGMAVLSAYSDDTSADLSEWLDRRFEKMK